METLEILSKVYGESTMVRSKVYELHHRFKEGRASIEYNKRTGGSLTSPNAESVALVSESHDNIPAHRSQLGSRFVTSDEVKVALPEALREVAKNAFQLCFQKLQEPWSRGKTFTNVCVYIAFCSSEGQGDFPLRRLATLFGFLVGSLIAGDPTMTCALLKKCPKVSADTNDKDNDKECVYTATTIVDKVILGFVQSSRNIIDADFNYENEINNTAPVPTSSEVRNIM
ncbi:hypothetical protein TNCV_2625421 [Trichonephila clavipes]|nr:hypothetical protein TNCV_2625421 [Trichonephila clavipes]